MRLGFSSSFSKPFERRADTYIRKCTLLNLPRLSSISATVLIGLALATLAGPAAAQEPPASAGEALEQCRVVENTDAGWQLPAYTWFCDASGVPTYTEILDDGEGKTGVVIGYYDTRR